MKKVLILVGSARNGNSLFLANQIVRNYPADIIPIAQKRITPCNGCLACDDTKKCIFFDDMEVLIKQVVDADVIVMISPTRCGLLSGDIKLFIDRLNPIATTEELAGKNLIVVAIGQSDYNDSSIIHAIKSMEFFSESSGMNLLGSIPIYECLAENDLGNKIDVVNKTISEIVALIG
jgi:multimeric flavodoxin WrbA